MADWKKIRVWLSSDGSVKVEGEAVISEALARADWNYGRPRHGQAWLLLVEQDDLVIMLNRETLSVGVVGLIYRKVS